MERDYDVKKAQIFFELCTLKNKARNNLRNQANLLSLTNSLNRNQIAIR
jgi:hypothetical protein